MSIPLGIEPHVIKNWQRARIYSADRTWVSEVWVRYGPPRRVSARPHPSRCGRTASVNLGPTLRYKTNVYCPHDNNRECWVAAADVELLPRFASRAKYLECNDLKYSRTPLSKQEVRTGEMMDAAE